MASKPSKPSKRLAALPHISTIALETRDTVVTFRLTPGDVQALDRRARGAGLGRSSLVRHLVEAWLTGGR